MVAIAPGRAVPCHLSRWTCNAVPLSLYWIDLLTDAQPRASSIQTLALAYCKDVYIIIQLFLRVKMLPDFSFVFGIGFATPESAGVRQIPCPQFIAGYGAFAFQDEVN